MLAFLFRTFAAEAFVIPTGSMAPTLMGQHKDVLCRICGYRYQAGASSESEDLARQRGLNVQPRGVSDVTCPLCRYTESVDAETKHGRQFPTYSGDRILVSKFAYEFAEPNRWDVIVFRYPNEAQTNYIKRLVGLPRETVRIWHGDIYTKRAGQEDFELQRRRPVKIRAMAQMVYDNDYVVEAMTAKSWPLRWQPWPSAAAAPGAWSSVDGGRSYQIDGSAAEPAWLRYQHFVPSLSDWAIMRDGPLPANYRVRPSLITDFYAYDTSVQRGDPLNQPAMLGLHWVGDLLLECQLQVQKPQGSAILDLVKGGRHFRCTIDCQTGGARLSVDGLDGFGPQAQTALRAGGEHRVLFANVDEQLLLWVDGSPVTFDAPTTYRPLDNDRPRASINDPGDLAPAGVGSDGTALSVKHLRLWRDMYYIAARDGGPVTDYASPLDQISRMTYDELFEFWSNPAMWEPQGRPSPFDQRREAVFPLADDQFFVLGDNSPLSQDARLWGGDKFVSRELLVGKALLIFWPHSFHRVPGTGIPFPFFPNFARMRFIE